MKRKGQLIAKIADIDNLRLAFYKAQKGKTHKEEVVVYRNALDENLLQLRQQLLNAQVSVGNYYYFTIHDPKERVICAAAFPERVLHHALMNICHEVFENYQITDSYATRPQKGTYAALKRAKQFHQKNAYFLKMDVRKYFDSIHHDTLNTLLQQRFKDPVLRYIFGEIISSYKTKDGRGLPIGNLTSQYFANFYLAFLDRYIKQTLHIKAYVRYMDDMILWSNNKQDLLETQSKIVLFLQEKLQLQLKINYLNKSQHGLPFIGYRLFPNKVLLNTRSKKRFKQKMKKYYYYLKNNYFSQADYQQHLEPLIAFTQYADAKAYRQHIISRYSTI